MSNLPNPKEFASFKAELSKTIKFDEVEQSYDLKNIFDSLQNNSIPSGYISKLIDLEILEHNPKTKEILKGFICYSKLDDSIVIVLKDKEEIKTIAINRAKDKEGNLIKWKTFGSKKYIQYKIKDDFVFIVYGMSEIILCELFDISYIAFQSDSITYGLDNHSQWIEEIKPMIQDKYLILLLDNDDSCRKTINPIKEQLANPGNTIIIEMIDLLQTKAFLTDTTGIVSIESRKKWQEHHNKILDKGYDFKDFCNEVKNPQTIEEILKNTIKAKL
jgi:hypothetical protein